MDPSAEFEFAAEHQHRKSVEREELPCVELERAADGLSALERFGKTKQNKKPEQLDVVSELGQLDQAECERLRPIRLYRKAKIKAVGVRRFEPVCWSILESQSTDLANGRHRVSAGSARQWPWTG